MTVAVILGLDDGVSGKFASPRLGWMFTVQLWSLRDRSRQFDGDSCLQKSVSSVFPPTAAPVAPGFQLAGAVVIVSYVGLLHAIVVKVAFS